MEIKTKLNKWDLMKLKSFFKTKKTKNKMRRQPSEWEKIFANEATVKGLMSKYTSSSCSSISKTKQLKPKMVRRPKQTFLQRRYPDCQ